MRNRPPFGIRLLHSLGSEPDWLGMSDDELAAFQVAENRKRASRFARLITGRPERGVDIRWQQIEMPGRAIMVRVYRPAGREGRRADGLPIVVHVHGGGFVGTAVQSDWVNSHLALHLPAVVVSVEHRLLGPGVGLSEVVDDGWDVLVETSRDASRWGGDPDRLAIFGESTGGIVTALNAIRARDWGLSVRAQVLVNPVVDLTSKMWDHDSIIEHAESPTLTTTQMQLFARLAVPAETDPLPLSPLHANDLSGLAPAFVVVPTFDPAADHGRAYAASLWEAGTPARLAEHSGATHAFLSMPGVVPQAKRARAEILDFLRDRLL